MPKYRVTLSDGRIVTLEADQQPTEADVLMAIGTQSKTPVNEQQFQSWYADASKRYRLNPNPDDPEQKYDYRSAFQAGATPDASGHWPSDFKQAGHPNEIVGGFNTRTGERVKGQPQASEQELVRLGWDPETAKRLSATEIDAHGNRIVRNPDGSVKFMQGPGYRGTTEGRPDSNVATLGGFGIAPEDVLAAPSLARGAGRLISAGASALRRPLAGALDVGATVLDNPIVGMMSPRAQQAGQLMGRAAPVLRGAPAAAEVAAPAVAEAVAPAVEAAAPRLATATTPSKAMQAAREAFSAAGETARPAEASNVMELIRRGKEPQEALRLVLSKRPAAAVTQEVATVAEKMPKLTGSEVKAGMDLIARGKTPQQAMDAILAQREFLAKMGGGAVTDDAAKAALDLRNARGQIKTPSAQTAELRRGR